MRDGSSDGSSACWRTDNKMKSLTVGLWQSASWRLFNPLWSEGTDLSTRQRRRRRRLTSEPDTCYLHNKSSLCWYWKRASGTWGASTMTANTLCAGAAAIHGADVLINDAFEGLLAIPSCHLSLSLSERENWTFFFFSSDLLSIKKEERAPAVLSGDLSIGPSTKKHSSERGHKDAQRERQRKHIPNSIRNHVRASSLILSPSICSSRCVKLNDFEWRA